MRAANPVGPGLQQGPGLNGVPSRQGIDANWNKRYWVGSAYNRNGVGVRIPGAASSPTNSVGTSDHGTLRITGDIDIRIKTRLRNWAAPGPVATAIVPLVSKLQTSLLAGYRFSILPTGHASVGRLNFGCYVGGVAQSATSDAGTMPAFDDNTDHWLRVTRTSATGAVRFYWCPTEDGATWVQIGADVASTAGALGSATNSANFLIGSDGDNNGGAPQIVSNVSIWNGIEGSGGVNVFNADFAAQATGTTSFVEANGRTVTITSAEQSWGSLGAWSESSGGVGGASLPTAISDVFFDGNSGPVAMSTLSFTATCRALNFTGFTGTWTMGIGVPNTNVWGSFTLSPTMTYNSNGSIAFNSISPATEEIRTFGKGMPSMTFNGGSWKFMDDCAPRVSGNTFTLAAGATCDTNGFTMGTKLLPWNMTLNGTSSRRVLKLGSSTVWCTSWSASTAGLDLDPGTSTINVVGVSGTFSSRAPQRYNVVAFPAVAGASYGGNCPYITGSGDIAHLIVRSVSTQVYVNSGVTSLPAILGITGTYTGTITDLTIEGQPGVPLLFGDYGTATSYFPGAAKTLTVTNPPTLSDVTFTDITASGASVPWSGTRLGDGGGNTNITFPVSQTNYWVPSTTGLTGTGLYCGTHNEGTNGTYASTPDSVPLSVLGDLDLRVKLAGLSTRENGAQQDLICKGVPSASLSYEFYITYLGAPRLTTTANGFTSRTSICTESLWPLDLYTAGWLRVTRNATTGAVIFYTSPDGSTWTQLGTTVAGTAGAIADSSGDLFVGRSLQNLYNYDGTILRAQVYDGIDGTLVFDADFETAPAAAGSFTESSVNAATVTINNTFTSSRGRWSDAAHWASSTGGASGSGRVPLAHDDVVFDAPSSASPPSNTLLWVLMDVSDLGRNINGTGSTVTLNSWARTSAGGAGNWMRCWGSFTAGGLTEYGAYASGYQSLVLTFLGRGSTFTHSFGSCFGWGSANTGSPQVLYFAPLASTTHSLGSDLNTTYQVAMAFVGTAAASGGTFDAAGYNVTCGAFLDTLTTQVRTVNFGSGTWTLTGVSGTVLSIPNQANLTLAGNPAWVVSETLDAVVKDGKWRVPQYGSDPSNTTRATNYVAGDAINGSNTWQTPRPATALTDDLDIIVRFNRDFTTQIAPLLHTWNLIPTPGISFVSYVSATNVPVLQMSTNGTTSSSTATCTAPLPFGNGVTGWLRVTRNKTTGEVKFYTCADQVAVPSGGDWVQLGTTVITLFTSTLYAGTTDLAVGQSVGASALPRGLSIYHAQVSNVIGGAPVATLDFTALPDYSLSTTDPQGNVWRSYQYAARTARRVVGGNATGPSMTAGNSWATPDYAAVSITSAIDIQVRSKGMNWSLGSGVMAGKLAAGNISYYFSQAATNGLLLNLSANGTTSTQALTLATMASLGIQNGMACWLRVTWRASDGRVQFFYAADSPSLPGVWTQIGPDRAIALASIYDGWAPLELGVTNAGATSPFAGDIYRVRIFNGIEGSGGTLAFDADFTTLQDDTYAFRESSANNAVVYASADGGSGLPAGRTTKSLSVSGKNLPGSSLVVQAGGAGILYISGSVNAAGMHGFPALVCVGGKWLWATDLNGGTSVFPSITWTTTPTGPRNAFVRRPLQCKWSSGGLVTVNYADVLWNDADGASIPFSNVNGFLSGTTDWIDENIYPDYIILGMQD